MTLIPPPSQKHLRRARAHRRTPTQTRPPLRTLVILGMVALSSLGFTTVRALDSGQDRTLTAPNMVAIAQSREQIWNPRVADQSTSLPRPTQYATPRTTLGDQTPNSSTQPTGATSHPSGLAPVPSSRAIDACPEGDFSGNFTDGRCLAAAPPRPGIDIRRTPSPKPTASQEANTKAAIDTASCRDNPRAAGCQPTMTPTPKAQVKLMQATSTQLGEYYCATWWAGAGTGSVESGGHSYRETGTDTGSGGTFTGEPGSLATCTFSLNGQVVGKRMVLIADH